MPQQLPEGVPIDPSGEPLQRRPDHAALIARIAAAWSAVEFLLAHILGQMMRAESRAALALYGTLYNNRAARKAVEAVAAVALSDGASKQLAKLMAESSRRADERNRIVHALWATAEAMPNVLVCLDNRSHLRRIAHTRHMSLFGSPSLEEASSIVETHDTTYTIQDLQNTVRRINHFRDKVAVFSADLDEYLYGSNSGKKSAQSIRKTD